MLRRSSSRLVAAVMAATVVAAGLAVTAQPATAATTETICGLSTDFKKIWRYSGSGTRWALLGEEGYTAIYGGAAGLLATIGNGNVYKWQGSPGSWSRIGGPAAEFVVTDDAIYSRATDNNSVKRYNSGTSWSGIGLRATNLWGGGSTLLRDTAHSEVYRYMGSAGAWELIDDTSWAFFDYAVEGSLIYQMVYRFSNPSQIRVYRGAGRWDDISPPFAPGHIYMYSGGYGLFAIDPPTGDIWHYLGGTQWEWVGWSGFDFAVTDTGLFGVSPGRDVFRYNGTPGDWSWIGDDVSRIVPCP